MQNDWSNSPRPDIQLEALMDIFLICQDSSKHGAFIALGLVGMLIEIISKPNPPDEQISLEASQRPEAGQGPSQQGRRESEDLDYVERKKLERKEVNRVHNLCYVKENCPLTTYFLGQDLDQVKS